MLIISVTYIQNVCCSIYPNLYDHIIYKCHVKHFTSGYGKGIVDRCMKPWPYTTCEYGIQLRLRPIGKKLFFHWKSCLELLLGSIREYNLCLVHDCGSRFVFPCIEKSCHHLILSRDGLFAFKIPNVSFMKNGLLLLWSRFGFF